MKKRQPSKSRQLPANIDLAETGPLSDLISWQSGKFLAREFYARNPARRLAFEEIAVLFLSLGDPWSPPSVSSSQAHRNRRDARSQTVLARTVGAIGIHNSRHGPEQLARFVVRVVREVVACINSKTSSPDAAHTRLVKRFTSRVKRHRFIRRQLRLPRPLGSSDRQTTRRFDRVFRAIIAHAELYQCWNSLLPKKESRPRLKRNLSKLFRHAAEQPQPSMESNVIDILTCHHEEIQRTDDADEKVQRLLVSYRKSRGLSLPQKPRTPDKKQRTHDPGRESLDVIYRRARKKSPLRFGK